MSVLVADDRPDVLEALRLLLKSAGHKAETVDSPPAVLRAVKARSFDLILMDLNYTRDTTSGQEGLELLSKLQENGIFTPVIVMTAWGNIELAVEAMRRGACDFIQKPWDNARLLAVLDHQAREGAERRRAEQRARSEIEIARNVQQRLFPQKTRQLHTIDYAARCVPAQEVGGDYYDFLDLGPSRQGFVLADVSGKGIAAALLMANLQGCFRSQSEVARSASELLRGVNELFRESTPPEQFATVLLGCYDDRTRRFRYVNGGHPAAVLMRASGSVERLGPTATVLGAFRDWSCEEAVVELAPGDTLVAFSDGVTEAGIESGAEFGEPGVLAAVGAVRTAPIEGVVDALIAAARGFDPDGQADDITVLGIRGV